MKNLTKRSRLTIALLSLIAFNGTHSVAQGRPNLLWMRGGSADDIVSYAAYDPSGQYIALQDSSGLKIVRWSDGMLLRTLSVTFNREGNGSIWESPPRFSPGGGHLLALTADQRVTVWRTDTWQSWQIVGPVPFVSMTISPHDTFVLGGGQYSTYVIDYTTAIPWANFDGFAVAVTPGNGGIAFHKYVFGGNTFFLAGWGGAWGGNYPNVYGYGVGPFLFGDHGGGFLCRSDNYNKARYYFQFGDTTVSNPPQLPIYVDIPSGPSLPTVANYAFAPDGRRFALTPNYYDNYDVAFYDTTTLGKVNQFDPHVGPDPRKTLAYSPDSAGIVVCGAYAKLFDAVSREPVSQLSWFRNGIQSCTSAASGDVVAAVDRTNSSYPWIPELDGVKFFSGIDGSFIRKWNVPYQIESLRLSPDGTKMIIRQFSQSAGPVTLHMVDAVTGTELYSVVANSPSAGTNWDTGDCEFSPDGTEFAFADGKIFAASTGQLIASVTSPLFDSGVRYSPSGTKLLIGHTVYRRSDLAVIGQVKSYSPGQEPLDNYAYGGAEFLTEDKILWTGNGIPWVADFVRKQAFPCEGTYAESWARGVRRSANGSTCMVFGRDSIAVFRSEDGRRLTNYDQEVGGSHYGSSVRSVSGGRTTNRVFYASFDGCLRAARIPALTESFRTPPVHESVD